MGSAVSAETTSLTKLPPGLARVCRVLRGTPPRVRGGPQRTRTRGRSSLDGDRLRGGSPPVAAPPQAARAAPVPHTRGLPSCSRPAGPCSRPRHRRGPRPLGRSSGVLSLPGGALSVTPASAVCVCVCTRACQQLSFPSPHTNLGFLGGSVGKESTCSAGDWGSVPGSGKIPWTRERQPPLQYPWLDHLTDRGAWRATVHGVAKNRTGLSD